MRYKSQASEDDSLKVEQLQPPAEVDTSDCGACASGQGAHVHKAKKVADPE